MATAKQEMTFEDRIAIATAKGWRPSKGDTLRDATVVKLSIGHTEEYGDYPKITYALPDGSFVAVHAFHTVLRDRLRELKTEIGSQQTIVYLGRETSNSRTDSKGQPQEYESYYVEDAKDASNFTAKEEGFAF